MKIGIDIVSVDKFKGIKKNDFKFWDKIFTKSEWSYCFKDKHYSQHLAGIFAAKEAAFKAVGNKNMSLADIEISHKNDGLPVLNLNNLFVSISHTEDSAVAIVIGL